MHDLVYKLRQMDRLYIIRLRVCREIIFSPQEETKGDEEKPPPEEPEPDLQFWENELSKGPLYMLLLK